MASPYSPPDQAPLPPRSAHLSQSSPPHQQPLSAQAAAAPTRLNTNTISRKPIRAINSTVIELPSTTSTSSAATSDSAWAASSAAPSLEKRGFAPSPADGFSPATYYTGHGQGIQHGDGTAPGRWSKHGLRWGEGSRGGGGAGLVQAWRARFDRAVPPQRTYFGRGRRTCVWVVVAIVVLLVFVLALALGLGLKKSHHSSRNLPLPTNHGIFTGDLTYYAPALGACGLTSTSTQAICALSHLLFDAASTGSNPNANPLCGRRIRVARYNAAKGDNRSIDLTVVDRCVGCEATDVDLSLSAFEALASEGEGRVTGSWAWLD